MQFEIIQKEETKNTSERKIEQQSLPNDLFLLKITPHENEDVVLSKDIPKGIIQFYFCLEGSITFSFGGPYQRTLEEGKNYLIYFPNEELKLTMNLATNTKMVGLFLPLATLHELFVSDPASIHFMQKENASHRFYEEHSVSGPIMVALNQLFYTQLSQGASQVFAQGKALEILGLYFNVRETDLVSCPFLIDEDNVKKIKLAKEYLIKNMTNPPSIQELADEVKLSEHRLKAGFKEVYGNTVFGYLLDHKMEHSRQMLDSGKFMVNEVAYQLGYTNPSHFISAFKKKYGITPKKYLSVK